MPARTKLTAILILAVAASPACFVRRRTVGAPAAHANRPVLSAAKEELIRRIHKVSDPIKSQKAATDYATIGAYLLFRRPDQMRMVGQDPVIESTIFDMVSRGNEFRLHIPRKKKFFVGTNDSHGSSENKLENLRPSAFLSALMINPPDPATETALLEDDTSEEKAVYILLILRKDHDQLSLARNVYFDRYTLDIARQKTFDSAGNIVSETRYAAWTNYDGISFPTNILIRRPKDNYEVQLSVTSLRFNTADVTEEKFNLTQPPGTELQQLK